ncbi:hypothetical protein Wcon_00373 [Wolbachia endosymbiont of Cylisticus convexus]|uniref:hypothetical protein n=1 Tax=Wolbachia endosymbiont of Cylisticus convexus TaxID=118728 RepID=UPI000DF6CD49|nr:hypothetical protein [Wolbachia endosymbiont of Cylisticus convexus]RDD35468.1 hypothetical protein Wcon_00373 [Wolbachia endosymbiont of Cylisticus convexus]
MSKGMVNALKTQTKKLKYTDLKAATKKTRNKDSISSGHSTYVDLEREQDLTINGQVITNKFINELCSKHENMILEGENGQHNYRPFLKQIFVEMFEHVGASIPNNSIIEELITNYNQAGYSSYLSYQRQSALNPFGLLILDNENERRIVVDCNKPDCLECSFSYRTKYVYDDHLIIKCNLSCSAEFQLQFKDGNVTYEDGKVLLTIPKELEDYKAGDDSLLDKLTDIINKLVEYFKKLCEKLGFKFDTKVEYNSECNIKIEHNLGKPLKAIDEPDVYVVNGLKPKAQ